MSSRKLKRSKTDRMVAGVIGGVAEYFNIDSSLLRIIAALLTFFSAGIGGLIAYGIAWAIIPEERS